MMNIRAEARIVQRYGPKGTVWIVEEHWLGGSIDRRCTMSWSCGTNHRLAMRLARAIDSNRCHEHISIKTDINGETYVEAHLPVIGRRMNADLKRLGY